MKIKTKLFFVTLFIGVILLIPNSVKGTTYQWDISENEDNSVIATLKDTTLSITGKGRMKESYNIPWKGYNIENVIIESGVENIGNGSFRECYNLTSITMSHSITSIGSCAFENCSKLTNVMISNSTTNIGEDSFDEYSNLTNIIIPNNMTSVGDKAFFNCTNLTEVTMPNGVTSIGRCAFYNCINLKNITLSKNLMNIERQAFQDCKSLRNITIPNSVTSIGNIAFFNCQSMEYVELPSNLCTIGKEAFYGCSMLREVKSYQSINLIDNISSEDEIGIGEGAFSRCGKLKNVEIPERISSIDEYAFEFCYSLESVKIPENVTSIKEGAFYNCTNLKNITLPQGISEIDTYLFFNCKSLESIEIPKGVTYIWAAFEGCTSLTTIVIPNGIRIITDSQFKDSDLLTIYTNCNSGYVINYANKQNIKLSMIHNWDNYYTVDKEATCTEQGTKSIHCLGCGIKDENSIKYIPKKINITACTIHINEPMVVDYCGLYYQQGGSMIIEYNNTILKRDVDYTITYLNNKNAGTAIIEIMGIGIYGGKCVKTFEILPINLNDTIFTELSDISNKMYTGSKIEPSIIVKYNFFYDKKVTLKLGVDYKVSYKNNINAGKATAIITGIGNYTGEITKTFKINPISFTNSKVSGIKTKEYTGKNLTQSITVKYENKILIKDKDYKVNYSNHKNPGKATIKITGIGNYTGTITKTFIIKPKKVSGFKVKEQKTDSIKLSWSKHEGVTGYKLYSYNYEKNKWEYVGKTSKTSHTIKKLKVGTTYKYRVRAYKTVDGTQYYGSYTSSLKTTTKTKTPSISKLTTKSKKATIKWKKISGASGYQIYMATSKNGKYSKIKTITKGSSESYTKTKLKRNKKYYFKIRTYRTVDGKKVYSSYSSVKSIKVK